MIDRVVPWYSTLVVFGQELVASVRDPYEFEKLVSMLEAAAGGEGSLFTRGRIEGPLRKNLAPRAGLLNQKKIADYRALLRRGWFFKFEVRSLPWGERGFPDFYGSIDKIWEPSPDGYEERTETGIENAVMIAKSIGRQALSMTVLESLLKQISSRIDGVYGFIEPAVQWDVPMFRHSPATARTRLMDDRVLSVWADFRRQRADCMIPRLYQGNLLCRAHFKVDPRSLLGSVAEVVEPLGGERYYVRLVEDPQINPEFHARVEALFNMVPGTQRLPGVGDTFPPYGPPVTGGPLVGVQTAPAFEVEVYDKAKWHFDEVEAAGLEQSGAYVPGGFLLGWAIDRGLWSEELREDLEDEAPKFTERKLSGPRVYESMDGGLTNEDFAPEIQPFIKDYMTAKNGYFHDYIQFLCSGDERHMWGVADSWENYSTMKRRIDERYEAWLSGGRRQDHV